MIRINLLPEERRIVKKKKKAAPEISFSKRKMIFMAIGAIFIIHVIAGVAFTWTNTINMKSSVRLKALGPDKEKFDTIKSELRLLQSRKTAIDALRDNRTIWSQKLNELSNLVLDGIWFDELSWKKVKPNVALPSRKKTSLKAANEPTERLILMITGFANSDREDATALVGRFIQMLKDDQQYMDSFDDIELVSIRKTLIKDSEVMNFVINCYFKDDTDKKSKS